MYVDITGIAVKLDSRSALSPLASCFMFCDFVAGNFAVGYNNIFSKTIAIAEG